MLVASTGGHLAELHRLRHRIDGLRGPVLWITFDSEQSRELLAGEEVIFVPLTGPRDYRNVFGNMSIAWRVLRTYRVSMIVSTGSAIALSFFPLAWLFGASCHFIETAARRHGPSLTGRIVGLPPGVHRYTQCQTWAGRRWKYRGSLFDGFDPVPHSGCLPQGRPVKVVVMLGTMQQPFDSALRPLAEILKDPGQFEVKWQVGHTPTEGLEIDGHVSVSPFELQRWIAESDLVIAHAGMGSTLDALEAGRRPLLIARTEQRGEHVDDHQVEIANELAARDLAEVTEPAQLSIDCIRRAVGGRVSAAAPSTPARFPLQAGHRRVLRERPAGR